MADWARGGLDRCTVAVQDGPEEDVLKQKKVPMVSSHSKNPHFIMFSPDSFIYLQFSVLFHPSAAFLRLHQKYFRAEGQPSPEDTDSGAHTKWLLF